jgi:hypothetical protein
MTDATTQHISVKPPNALSQSVKPPNALAEPIDPAAAPVVPVESAHPQNLSVKPPRDLQAEPQ